VPVVGVLVSGKSLPDSSWAWNVPFGSFTVGLDPLSAWFAAPILGLAILAAVYGAGYLSHYADHKSLGPPWLFFNLLVAAMVLVVVARNGMLFLVAWEGMALASYFLVTFEDEQSRVREAGRIYLIASHLGTACLLLFFALCASYAGSLDFASLAGAKMAGQLSRTLAAVLFLLALLGFGTKAGFMPLHVWLPEAHPAAPSHVSALMSGVMIKTGIYGMLRALTFLGTPPAWWAWTLIAIGVTSGILGVLFAAAQQDLKRLLAYSSVENVGVIALGLGIGMLGVSLEIPSVAAFGFAGGLLHVLNHAIFKGLLFFGAGAALQGAGTGRMDLLGGLVKRMPAAAATFTVAAAAVCALPPFNGFLSEFLIFSSAFQRPLLATSGGSLVALAAIGSLALIGGLAAACFTKALGIVFLGEPRTKEAAAAHPPGWLMLIPMLVLAAGCLLASLAIPPLLAGLAPVLAGVQRQPVAVIAECLAPASDSLSGVLTVGGIVIVLTIVLAAVRQRLLRSRDVRMSVTWDCGYAAPAVRMQYTSTSYVQPLTDFFSLILRARKHIREPRGLFPTVASARTHHQDMFLTGLFSRSYRGFSWALARLHWLQHGRLNLYVLYIALTLVGLLAWEFGLGELFDDCAAWLAARQTMFF